MVLCLQWAAIVQELLRIGKTAIVANRVAGLASIIGPVLTAKALAVLARIANSRAVRDHLLQFAFIRSDGRSVIL